MAETIIPEQNLVILMAGNKLELAIAAIRPEF